MNPGLSRHSFRASDAAWNAALAAAKRNGEDLSSALRTFLSDYAMGHSQEAPGYRTEYRVTSKVDLDGAPVVIAGITGELSDIKKLYPPTRWVIEEYDISAPRPIKRRQ